MHAALHPLPCPGCPTPAAARPSLLPLQVQLVNLLLVHPLLVKNNSLESPSVARDVPLGLAHLLATTDVHVYLDGSAGILNCLAK